MADFVVKGGRVALFFDTAEFRRQRLKTSVKCDEPGGQKAAQTAKDVWSFWDFDVKAAPGRGTAVLDAAPTDDFKTALGLENLPLRAPAGYFVFDDPGKWSVLYSLNGKPVVAERQAGKGSVVVATGSFVLTNEVLRSYPRPAFVSWLVADRTAVVFEERHHGYVVERNMIWLLKRHNLGLLCGTLAALVVLILWRSMLAVPPVPGKASEHGAGSGVLPGRSILTGLENLLRQHIPRRMVMNVIRDEWLRTAKARRIDRGKIALVEEMLGGDDAQKNPVAVYNRIQAVLSKRRD